LKEWQRWERLARELGEVGRHHREAECLRLALEFLPPYDKDEKEGLVRRLDEADRRAREEGDEDRGGVGLAIEGLEPEDARERVLIFMREACRGPEGIPEETVVRQVTSDGRLEEELVREAIEELVDDGLLYHLGPGILMVDGVVAEGDLEDTILEVISELTGGGRDASTSEVIRLVTDRGIPRDEVEEALEELEESGRLDEGHPGLLRPALAPEEIGQLHSQVLSCLDELDPHRKGVLATHLVRDLSQDGWEVEEVEEAMRELEDSGVILERGGAISRPLTTEDTEVPIGTVLELSRELAAGSDGGFSSAELIRRAGRMGLRPEQTLSAMDELIDQGELHKDRHGLLVLDAPGFDPELSRRVVLEAVQKLQRGHAGALRAEVLEEVVGEGLEEDEAIEALEELIDDGLAHDSGDGFIRPG
jgi:hypothetical protein